MDSEKQDQQSPASTSTNDNGTVVKSIQERNILMAVLSYVSILVILSYLTAKDDPFVKYHIKQGLILFAIEIGIWVLTVLLPFIYPLWDLAQVVVVILSIVGIVNAVHGKEKALPVIGSYAKDIHI